MLATGLYRQEEWSITDVIKEDWLIVQIDRRERFYYRCYSTKRVVVIYRQEV